MKTSPATWKASLDLQLNSLTRELGRSPRVAILGVGNPMRSDDAAGILAARNLSQREWGIDRILIVEAGQAPENSTGTLRRFRPDVVLIIDAADMREAPGTIRWIPEESIDGMSASTHSLPLSMLTRYLKLELNCTVTILGIQAVSNEVGEEVSPKVSAAINEIVAEMARLLRNVRNTE
jgi:hydrogenase 3 maturation protease